MTVESKVSIKNILRVLYTHNIDWEDCKQQPLRYVDFEYLVMVVYELTTQDRICKEKWKKLRDYGVFIGRNKAVCVVDLERVREIIEAPLRKKDVATPETGLIEEEIL